MYDCPRCNGVETLRYNLYYDVYICLACGISATAEEDDPSIVSDYIMKNEQLVTVTEYILPIEQVQEADIDYTRLEQVRHRRTPATDRSGDGVTRKRRSRKNAKTGDVADQKG